MDNIESIVKTIVTTRINQDESVKDDSYVLSPYMIENGLKGDGVPQELITTYQLDFFFSAKGKTLVKSKALLKALGSYNVEYCKISWEQNARLWRGTLIINSIE